MKLAVCILALAAFISANPGANEKWHWVSPKPLLTPNSKSMPFNKFAQLAVAHNRKINPKFQGHLKAVPNCGVAGLLDKDSRIVNGEVAIPHEFPWQVALYIDDLWFCGGSLINEEWVLTAGHCTTGSSFVSVVLGAHDLSVNEPTQVTIVSTEIITHPQYDGSYLSNDFGLIHLPTQVTYTSAIKPICLPSYSDVDLGVGVLVTTSGWGLTRDNAPAISDTLNKVTDPTISNADCTVVYGSNAITTNTVCIATSDGNKGTCGGDSGGPLMFVSPGGVTYHRGATSFGASSGCERGYPNGFMRTTHFLDWISTTTGILIDP